MAETLKSLPLPQDPLLARWASALNDAGYWAGVLDAEWRFVFFTDELRLSFVDIGAADPAQLVGTHLFSAEWQQFKGDALGGDSASSESRRAEFLELGGRVLSETPGGREELRRVVNPELAGVINQLHPEPPPPVWLVRSGRGITTAGADVTGSTLWFRIDGTDGHRVGMGVLNKPAAGMSALAMASMTADLAHLERMRVVDRPDRRPSAILMADLEGSSSLARRLSSAQYFAFGRRLVRTADQCVLDAGGIVGRHAGDGVVAFFLADTAGSESAAASACITAARAIRDALPEVAARSQFSAAECSLRFGLHWGATVYMGRILTGGRSEVTALGDEVNEAARIEACATGGRILASKSLLERLSVTDTESLGLDTGHTTYTPLAELPTATDKARRDAPSIAVCEV